jgi:CHAT domain-containing protein/Tfp pilus assembly protein PilF
LFGHATEIWQKVIGLQNPDLPFALDGLAATYQAEGKYSEAEQLLQQAVQIRRKDSVADSPYLAYSLTGLARLYEAEGKYAEADPLFHEALRIEEKSLGAAHPKTAELLNLMAGLCVAQGNYTKAEQLLARALKIREQALGPEHSSVAESQSNLATVYASERKYADAERLYQRAVPIWEKAAGPRHPDLAATLINLAMMYEKQGKYADGESVLNRALQIDQSSFGPGHPELARALNTLGVIYCREGKYAKAEASYVKALAIWEKALGPSHPNVGDVLFNMAIFYYQQGRSSQAQSFFERGFENLRNQFEQHFTYMSEKERLTFLSMVSNNFPAYMSFCFANRDRDPALIGKMYDLSLWQKGLVARSITALRARVAASNDTEAVELLDKLMAARAQLAQFFSARPGNGDGWRNKVDQLEQESNELERQLVKRSSALAEHKKLQAVTWRDVQKTLKPGDAAVEFVRFPQHDGKQWTGKSYYIALLLAAETSAAPILVPLGEADVLEGAPVIDYRRHVAKVPSEGAGSSFYQAFWKPLDPYLASHRHIYVSPDGILNEVSLAVVPAEDGRLLMDKYDLETVLSTKDVWHEFHRKVANSAVLIGDPKFNLDPAGQKIQLQALKPVATSRNELTADLGPESTARGPQSHDCPGMPKGGVLCPLQSTEIEVSDIFSLLKQANWNVTPPYTKERALKAVVTGVEHPRLLHLATHGFFSPDQDKKTNGFDAELPSGLEDPMLRSGLMFAGADRAFKGEPTGDVDNGVLTAYEAAGMDLEGTELVVLSACETGLGVIRNGEGVFGLRRALQEAGAESVLMSLWSAPDRETRELMTIFYENWLAGKDKREALHEAQLEMRKKIMTRWDGEDRPYYWGAFVLVGR